MNQKPLTHPLPTCPLLLLIRGRGRDGGRCVPPPGRTPGRASRRGAGAATCLYSFPGEAKLGSKSHGKPRGGERRERAALLTRPRLRRPGALGKIPPGRGHLAGEGALMAPALVVPGTTQGKERRGASPPAPPSQHKGKVVLSPGVPSGGGQKLWDTLTAPRASLTALIVKARWQQGCPHPY